MSSKMITTMRLFLISCVALVSSSCSRADIGGQEAEHNRLTAAEVDAGWQLLFDGETTNATATTPFPIGAYSACELPVAPPNLLLTEIVVTPMTPLYSQPYPLWKVTDLL